MEIEQYKIDLLSRIINQSKFSILDVSDELTTTKRAGNYIFTELCFTGGEFNNYQLSQGYVKVIAIAYSPSVLENDLNSVANVSSVRAKMLMELIGDKLSSIDHVKMRKAMGWLADDEDDDSFLLTEFGVDRDELKWKDRFEEDRLDKVEEWLEGGETDEQFLAREFSDVVDNMNISGFIKERYDLVKDYLTGSMDLEGLLDILDPNRR